MQSADRPFASLTDEQWLEVLIRSVREPVVDGVEMPRFPHGNSQRQFVGSADEDSLREAYSFYVHVKGYADALGRTIDPSMRVLDFGAGWGRFARFFWRDVGSANIFAVDVDPGIVATARHLGVPGTISTIEKNDRLPFEDGSFDLIYAYSVFTHLPESTAAHWMRELYRVARPGCVFCYTVEPRRFLQFIHDLDESSGSGWHAALASHKPSIAGMLRDYDEGKFCYLPTGGGEYRDVSVYGDAIVPELYIDREWSTYFKKMAYVDDQTKFPQAFVASLRA